MIIELPKIVKRLQLAEYAEEFGEQFIEIWVNPPRDVLIQHDDLVKLVMKVNEDIAIMRKAKRPQDEIDRLTNEIRELQTKIAGWYSKIWSQGETAINSNEVEDLLASAHESDPAFETWIVTRTLDMIKDHREGRKKV